MEPNSLVAGMLAGDEGAWRSFLDRYGRLIYAISGRQGLDEAEREDHFQVVCISVHRSLATLREPERLASWLYNIAYRAGIDVIRRRRRQIGLETIPDADAASLSVGPEAADALERLQEVSLLQDAMSGLDERCRDLLRSLFLEDPAPSYGEISRRLRIPMGSIGPTRARCLKKLQNRLAELSNQEGPASTGREDRPAAPPATDHQEKRE